MTALRAIVLICLASFAPTIVAGCATPPGVLFEPDTAKHEWPPPPDEPRIRYLGSLRSAEDLKPGASGAEAVLQFLFGQERVEGLVNPIGVSGDGGDRIFIVDSGARLLHVYNLKTREHARWAPPPKENHFVQPIAVAFDPVGQRVLVSDSAASVLFAFDVKGKFLGTLGEGSLKRPCGLVVRPTSGEIYVADSEQHQILVLAADGRELRRIGGRGGEPGRFNFPTQVAFDGEGRLYVSDSLNFRVQEFGPDDEFIRQIGRKGDMPGYFSQPKGLALDPEDHLYVVDANFESVQLFDPEGSLLMAFGHEGHGPGEFWLPVGIFIDRDARVWVADSFNRRIQVFQYMPAGVTP
ncbi:MAG: 6-bladed beta-propeller [Phycisphaerales bacterium]